MDVALATSGSIAALFDIAGDNSITADLTPGSVLSFSTDVLAKRVLDTYKQKHIVPGNAQLPEETVEGIGYWAIGEDFIVM